MPTRAASVTPTRWNVENNEDNEDDEDDDDDDEDERGVLHLRLNHSAGYLASNLAMAARYYASASTMALSRTWLRGTQAHVVRGGLLPREDAPPPPLRWLLRGRAPPPVKYCVVGSGVGVVVVIVVVVLLLLLLLLLVVVHACVGVGVGVDVGFRIQNLPDQWPLFPT